MHTFVPTLILIGCSSGSKPSPRSFELNGNSATEKIKLLPLAVGAECALGGVVALAWTEVGGNPNDFDQGLDAFLTHRNFCNTASKTITEFNFTPAECAQNGQSNCTTNSTYRAAEIGKLNPWHVRSGSTIAGISGWADLGSLLTIGAHRTQAAPAITFAQLRHSAASSTLWRLLTQGPGTGYREIPKIQSDDDGESGENNPVKAVIRNTSEWNVGVPRKVCGTSATNFFDKIRSCAEQHRIKLRQRKISPTLHH